jgi:hypothetical protein
VGRGEGIPAAGQLVLRIGRFQTVDDRLRVGLAHVQVKRLELVLELVIRVYLQHGWPQALGRPTRGYCRGFPA